MVSRLIHNWVYGGTLAGIVLLLMAPVLDVGWPTALLLVYLQLPIYMLHQFEEHDDDRFHRVVNNLLGKGRDVLPSAAIFVINVPGVWGLNFVSFWLAYRLGIGWGLLGAYALIINAIAHIGQAIRLRSYNPGLITSVLLFLPVGIGGLWAISATGEASVVQHVVGLLVGIALHAAIIVYVLGNARRLGVMKA